MIYNLTMTKPNSTDKILISELPNIEQVARYINDTLFSGIPIVTKQALYDLISRPHTMNSNRFKEFITIEKIRSKPIKL